MTISPLAGKPATKEMLVDLARLEREYYERRPDLEDPEQWVSFGTSGHRGSPLRGSFTEAHILAITQAICDYRHAQGTDGPLYMGKDTHAVSGRPSAPRSKSWRPTGCRRSSSETTASPRRRSYRAPSWSTTAGAPSVSPTALSSPPRTTRRKTAGSSTTRQTAVRPTPM